MSSYLLRAAQRKLTPREVYDETPRLCQADATPEKLQERAKKRKEALQRSREQAARAKTSTTPRTASATSPASTAAPTARTKPAGIDLPCPGCGRTGRHTFASRSRDGKHLWWSSPCCKGHLARTETPSAHPATSPATAGPPTALAEFIEGIDLATITPELATDLIRTCKRARGIGPENERAAIEDIRRGFNARRGCHASPEPSSDPAVRDIVRGMGRRGATSWPTNESAEGGADPAVQQIVAGIDARRGKGTRLRSDDVGRLLLPKRRGQTGEGDR